MADQAILPSPYEIKSLYPIDKQESDFITDSKIQIQNILNGKDLRKLLIIGPCSIHDFASTIDYANRLTSLIEATKEQFFIVMRTYFEKPRTKAGWKGFLYDPDLDGSSNVLKGLHHTRKLLVELAKMKIPTATEFLEPLAANYIDDLISWGCIGARTTHSQVHRQLASSLAIPIGFKNSTEGSIDAAINGIISAGQEHAFFSIDSNGKAIIKKAQGNSIAHLVLRGSELESNYDDESLLYASNRLKEENLLEAILVDCSHDNSRRDPLKQSFVFNHLLKNSCVKGLLLESHLEAGRQALNLPQELRYGVSITDGCLDWQTTNNLILSAAATLAKEMLECK